MKKLIIPLVIIILCFGLVLPVSAAPVVILDDTQLSFDVPPVIEDGRTLVPLRVIFEALEAEVFWDGETQTVTALAGNTEINLTIGQLTAYINNESYTLDVPARIIDGRTMVPLRFVSEALDADVQWDGTSQTITITTLSDKNEVVAQEPFVYRNTTWGASVDEVKACEKKDSYEGFETNSTYELLYPGLKIAGHDGDLWYLFENDRLYSIYYYLDSSSLNSTNIMDNYYALEKLISAKYGAAFFEPTWLNERYLDDIDKWGYALLHGDLALYSCWIYNNTIIELYMYMEEDELAWYIFYGDLDYYYNDIGE